MQQHDSHQRRCALLLSVFSIASDGTFFMILGLATGCYQVALSWGTEERRPGGSYTAELSVSQGMSAGCFLYGAISVFPLQIWQWRSCKVKIWFLDPGLSFHPWRCYSLWHHRLLVFDPLSPQQSGIASTVVCIYCVQLCRCFSTVRLSKSASVTPLNLRDTSGCVTIWDKE